MAALNNLLNHLRSRGVDPESTDVITDEESGIATFLLYNLSGQLVGYHRYNPNGDKKGRGDTLEAKYFTYVTKESEKSSKIAVWGMQYVDMNSPYIFVAEGVFDAVKIKNAGHPVIAVLSNNPKPLKPWLKSLSKKIITIQDNDDAGSALAKFGDITMKVPHPYKDLGDMPQSEVNRFIESIVSNVVPKQDTRLFIFDFDDTLARTNSRVKITNPKTGSRFITPAVYATYKPDPDDVFDYSEFNQLIDPQELPMYVKRLKSAIKTGADVAIVTARGAELPVAQFLQQTGITKGVKIAPVGSSDPTKKTDYIETKLKSKPYTDVIMYDDALKNITAFKSMQKKYPNILFHGHHVPMHHATPSKTRDTHKNEMEEILNKKIKNPETGNDILVKTALNYDKSSRVKKLAVQMVKQWMKK
jgi:hypothetical protein